MRRFFSLVVCCVLLAGCGGAMSPGTGPAPGGVIPAMFDHGAVKNPLPEPPVVYPVNHVATVSMVAQINPATQLPEFVYQGNNAGLPPTIEVKPGDTIVMDVENNLPRSVRGDSGMQSYMNVHFHGLTVSPNPPGDNVISMLSSPGGALHYVLQIPSDQEPGLYWYHPHVYRTTDYHVGQAGISGAIVVDGLERHFPQLKKMTEHVMIVRATGLRRDSHARPLPHVRKAGGSCGPDPGLTVSVNGAVHPTIDIAPGEQQFFRVINATGHKTLKLAVDGGDLQVVAIDGFALDTYPGTGPTETVPYIVVPSSARAEFIVTGPASGSGQFRTMCFDSGPTGDPDPAMTLAQLRAPSNHAGVGHHSQRLRIGAPLPDNDYSSPLPPSSRKRVVVLSEDSHGMYINGKHFSNTDPPMFVARAGTVEEWKIVNVTDEIHDFHIHQIHYVVKKVDGVPLAHPYWADSVVVPHQKNGVPGTLTLLMDFRDPIIKGMFMFHCHILDHEDAGMMAMIEVR